MRKYVKYHYASLMTPFPEMEELEVDKVKKKNWRIRLSNQHFALRIHGGNRIKNPARRNQ